MLPDRTADGQAHEMASSTSDERMLVSGAKALDERVWKEIFDTYYVRIWTFLRYRVGNISAAEDLASQVFVEAVAGIDRYTYRGIPLGAWLFRIARNVSSDYLRKQMRHERAAAEAAAESDRSQPSEPDVDVEQLMQALTQLTDDQRQVVVLRFFSDLSTADTATVMRKTPGSIKALQHRALASMRRALTADGLSAQGR